MMKQILISLLVPTAALVLSTAAAASAQSSALMTGARGTLKNANLLIAVGEKSYEEATEGRTSADGRDPVPLEEIRRSLQAARSRVDELERRLDSVEGQPEGALRTAAVERIAEEALQVHWDLALDDARQRVEVLRNTRAPGAPAYREIVERLRSERRTIAESVAFFAERARAERRSRSESSWFDFADGALNAGADGPPSQFDGFLRASRIDQLDPGSLQRTRLDMTAAFAPLVLPEPTEAEPARYPDAPMIFARDGVAAVFVARDEWLDEDLGAREIEHIAREQYGVELGWSEPFVLPEIAPAWEREARAREFARRSPLQRDPVDRGLILVALGTGLTGPDGGLPELAEEDEWIDYEVLAHRPATLDLGSVDDPMFHEAWREAQRTAPDEGALELLFRMESVVIAARKKLGADLRAREFELEGHRARWIEDPALVPRFARGRAELRRMLPDGTTERVEHVFVNDHIVVELEFEWKAEPDRIDVTLATRSGGSTDLAPVSLNGSSGVIAERLPDDPKKYRSSTFRLFPSNSEESPYLGGDATQILRVPLGCDLIASCAPGLGIECLPSLAPFRASPSSIGRSWEAELARVSQRTGVTIPTGRAHLVDVDGVEGGSIITIDGDTVRISAGDLAAMVLLRNTMMQEIQDSADRLDRIAQEVAASEAAALRWLLVDLRQEVGRGNTGLARVVVSSGLGAKTRTLANVLTTEWDLRDEHVRASLAGWSRDLARNLADRREEALERCREAEVDDSEALIRLVGVGMSPVARGLLPDQLIHARVDGQLRWVPDRPARSHLSSVATLHDELRAYEQYASTELDFVLMVASAGIGTLEYAGARTAAALIGGASLGTSVASKSVSWWRSVEEIELAVNAAGVVAHERLTLARAREESLLMIFVEAAIGGIGLGAEIRAIAGSRRVTRVAEEAREVLSAVEARGVSALGEFSESQRASFAAVVASSAEGTPIPATVLDPDLVRRATAILRDQLDELRAQRLRAWLDDPRYPRFSARRVAPDAGPEIPDGFPPATGDGRSFRFVDDDGTEQALGAGRRLGAGSKSVVHATSDGAEDHVLKLILETDPERAAAEVARMRAVASMLEEADIQHLKIVGSGERDGVHFVVQQRMPEGARTFRYRRVLSDDPGSEEVVLAGLLGQAPEEALPLPYQHALAELYQKVGRAGLVWSDGHLENVVFVQRGLRLEAVILDLGNLVRFNDDVFKGGMDMVGAIHAGGRGLGGVRSMRGAPRNAGEPWRNFIDAEFAMQKMLEHKHLISYDPTNGRWAGDLLDLDVVDVYFPGFRTHLGTRLDAVRLERGR